MTHDRVAPYAADTRAKGWRFELDLERVMQSDTWALASPEVRPWLIWLWSCAWQQVPCGSMPADEELIIARLGIPPELFAKAKRVLMRGWWLASDGRLYHPTLTERVIDMLKAKEKERLRKAEYRARMDAERKAAESGVPPDLSHGTDTGRTQESGGRDDTGTGTGTGLNKVSDEAKASSSSSATTMASKRPSVPCPYDAIVDAYHELLPSMPRVRLRDGKAWTKRQKAMRSLWGWVLSSRRSDGSKRADSGDEAMAWIRGYFQRAAHNDFLMGRTPRGGSHENWECDLDFLLSDKGMKQVIEKTRDAA